MKITYDTVSDSISCPDLTPEQTRALQSELSAALLRNDPVTCQPDGTTGLSGGWDHLVSCLSITVVLGDGQAGRVVVGGVDGRTGLR